MHPLLLALALVTSNPDCVAACPLREGETFLQLGVGTQKVLTVPDWRGTAYAGDVIDVRRIGSNQLLIIGASSGSAALDVFTARGVEHYAVKVTKLDPDSCGLSELWKQLPCGGDFDADFKSDRLRVVGTYRGLVDVLQVLRLAAKYPGLPIPPVPPVLAQRVLTETNIELFRAGLPVTVRCSGASLELQTNEPAALEAAKALIARHTELTPLCERSAP